MADAAQIPSMYSTVGQGQSNPLTQLHTFAQTQNLLQQNKVMQQEFAARKALGPIMQQSIDPDGNLNIGRLLIESSKVPEVAWKVPEMAMQAVQHQLTQAQTINQLFESEQKKLTAIGNAVTPLLTRGDIVSINDVTKALTDPALSQFITPKQSAELLAHLTQNGITSGPKLRQWLADIGLRTQGAKESLDSVYGKINPVAAGGTTSMQATSPFMGTSKQVGSITHTPTPGERNALEPVTVDRNMAQQLNIPEGTIIYKPRATTAPMQTGTGETAPGTGVQQQSNIDLGPKAVPTQRITRGPNGEVIMSPTGPLPRADAVVGPNAVAKDQSQVPAVKTLDPYRATAIKEVAEKYEPQLNEAVKAANGVKAVIIGQKEAAGHMTPGGMADFRAKAAQALQGLPGVTQQQVDAIGNGSLAWSQVFDKLSVQGATIAIGNLIHAAGGRLAQQEWARFLQAWPNLNTDPRATAKMLDFMEKLSNMTIAEKKHFDEFKKNPANDLTQWQGVWADKVSSAFDNYWDQVQKSKAK